MNKNLITRDSVQKFKLKYKNGGLIRKFQNAGILERPKDYLDSNKPIWRKEFDKGILYIPEIVVTGKKRYLMMPEDLLSFINAVTGGGLNRLSVTQNTRALYDLVKTVSGNMSVSDFGKSLLKGNNGIVSNTFAKKHPYISTGINLGLDIGVPYGAYKGIKYIRMPKSNNGNITENFLKFIGGSGKPISLAVPKTQAQKEMYQMLELSGVDMSKVGIEDINKALELREQLLFTSGKRFSYLEPVTHNTEIIRDIDNGLEIAYIGLRKPYLTNDKGFAEDAWILYSSNPRNKGLKIDMVENLSQTKPGFNKTYHGEQERLTNSAIQVGKQLGYEGVVSGESLLSPEKTVKMYPKYKHKRVLDLNGTYNWQNHNPELPQLPGPVYMLELPTYKTVVKSKIFDPKIIDSNGKMKIDWRKGASMFTAWGVPITLGGYTYANTQ